MGSKVQLPAWLIAVGIWIIIGLIYIFMADGGGSITVSNSNSLPIVSDDDDGVVLLQVSMFPNHPEMEEQYNQLQAMIQKVQLAVLQSQERNQILQKFQEEQARALLLIQQLQEQNYELLNTNNTDNDTTSSSSSSVRYNNVLSHITSLKQSRVESSKVEESHHHWKMTVIRTIISKILPELHQWMIEKNWMAIQSIWDEINTLHVSKTTSSSSNNNTSTTATTTTTHSDGQCTAPTLSSSEAVAQSDFATHEQLQKHFKNIKDNILLSQQKSSSMTPKLPLSFPSSVHTLQQFVHSTWNDTIQSIRDKEILNDHSNENTQQQQIIDSNSDNDSNVNCLPSIDWIYEWLNVGFDAIYRNNSSDIRRELLQAIYQKQHHLRYSNPDTNFDVTNVMLDIPSFVTTYQTHAAHVREAFASKPRYENLRQFLDRPSIYELSICIDTVLDFISGRNDMLDDLMDKYIFNNPRFIGVSSSDLVTSHTPSTTTVQVGPIIVAHIMNGLGHIPVPSKHSVTNIISYLQSKLYPLRKHTSE